MGPGQILVKEIERLGEFTQFMGATLHGVKRFWRRRSLYYAQCESIGVQSTFIIVVAGIFFGAVMGYQLYVGFHWFGMEELLGASVGVALYRDLASLMTAVVVTGRSGASMAAELATMRISEQIDALEVMAVDPFEYLVAPRVVSGLLMVPLLAFLFAGVASVAAAGIACGVMGLSSAIFWDVYTRYVDALDLFHNFSKSAVYGAVMAVTGCFYGFRAKGGAYAVGRAAQTTVVVAFLSVLLADYFLSSLLPMGLEYLVLD